MKMVSKKMIIENLILKSKKTLKEETIFFLINKSNIFVDGRLIGTIAERLQPDRFVLGGPGPDWSTAVPAPADYKDWMVHRAGLTTDEVEVLHDGVLLQASLELYAPLENDTFHNMAQSLSVIDVSQGVVAATDE